MLDKAGEFLSLLQHYWNTFPFEFSCVVILALYAVKGLFKSSGRSLLSLCLFPAMIAGYFFVPYWVIKYWIPVNNLWMLLVVIASSFIGISILKYLILLTHKICFTSETGDETQLSLTGKLTRCLLSCGFSVLEGLLLILVTAWSVNYMSFAVEKASPGIYDSLLKSELYSQLARRNVFYDFQKAKIFQVILAVMYEPIYFEQFTDTNSYRRFLQLEEVSKFYQLNQLKDKPADKMTELMNLLKSGLLKSSDVYQSLTSPEWIEDCKKSMPPTVLKSFLDRGGLFNTGGTSDKEVLL